jgi:hypothetical protein
MNNHTTDETNNATKEMRKRRRKRESDERMLPLRLWNSLSVCFGFFAQKKENVMPSAVAVWRKLQSDK